MLDLRLYAGTPIGDLSRQLGVSDATFYAWKKKYTHLGVSELRRVQSIIHTGPDLPGQVNAAPQ